MGLLPTRSLQFCRLWTCHQFHVTLFFFFLHRLWFYYIPYYQLLPPNKNPSILTLKYILSIRRWSKGVILLRGQWRCFLHIFLWSFLYIKSSKIGQFPAWSLICVRLFMTPRTVAGQALLSWHSPGTNTGASCYSLLQEDSLDILQKNENHRHYTCWTKDCSLSGISYTYPLKKNFHLIKLKSLSPEF